MHCTTYDELNENACFSKTFVGFVLEQHRTDSAIGIYCFPMLLWLGFESPEVEEIVQITLHKTWIVLIAFQQPRHWGKLLSKETDSKVATRASPCSALLICALL